MVIIYCVSALLHHSEYLAGPITAVVHRFYRKIAPLDTMRARLQGVSPHVNSSLNRPSPVPGVCGILTNLPLNS